MRRISWDPLYVRIYIGIISILLIYDLISRYKEFQNNFGIEEVVSFLLIVFLVGLSFRLKIMKSLYYDRKNLYIKTTQKEIVIPLGEIVKLEMTIFSIYKTRVWILYYNICGKIDKQIFFPGIKDLNNMLDFEELLKNEFTDVEVLGHQKLWSFKKKITLGKK